MSGGKSGKNWTIGTLKSRGWTDALVRELLPKPVYRHFNGRSVRTWNKELVIEAEKSQRFAEAAETAKKERSEAEEREKEASAALLAASLALVEECWQPGEEETDVSLLARHYHRGILGMMKSGAQSSLRSGKAMSYAGHLLALRQHAGDGDASPAAEMKHFAAAGYWLGQADEALRGRLREGYTPALMAAAERAIGDFTAAQPESDVHALLTMADFPVQELLNHPLSYLWSVSYVPRAIRSSLELLVALNPKDEYPEARALQRHFVVHIGGTNTGKTYAGFQRLIRAETGVYLAPLRLLALEAQETLLDYGVNCSLTTGEEEDVKDGDTHVAATAEKLDMKRRFDVAVIDECQMIADRERGYAWTRAILGVLAEEVHLCAAPEAKNLLLRLIRLDGAVDIAFQLLGIKGIQSGSESKYPLHIRPDLPNDRLIKTVLKNRLQLIDSDRIGLQPSLQLFHHLRRDRIFTINTPGTHGFQYLIVVLLQILKHLQNGPG